MVTAAYINIWGSRVGAIVWDEEQQLGSFEFDPKFQAHQWDLSPLKMPINSSQKIFSFPENRAGRNAQYDTFQGLPGLIADALPDQYGNQLINVFLARQGRPENSMNPVEKLCFLGSRSMGALEFEPARLRQAIETSPIEIDALVDIAAKILQKRSDFHTEMNPDANLDNDPQNNQQNQNKQNQEAIRQLISIGTSAGGARPKAVIAFNEKTNEVRSGQTEVPEGFEHWLIKLDGVSEVQLGDTHGYGRVEMAYYLMAKDAGIHMMPSMLYEENGRAHFMTKRFDRENGEKHHIQTFCALKHMDFNQVGAYSYEQLFQTMRQLRLSYPEAEQMFRRMVFNILARNCDDHTKNFAFILKKNQAWQLAPAYDLCYSYRPDSIWVSKHSISLNGKREDFTLDDLLTFAKTINIKKAKTIIQEVQHSVSNWPKFAKQVKVDPEKTRVIQDNLISF